MRRALHIASLLIFAGTAASGYRTTTHDAGPPETCAFDTAMTAARSHVSSRDFNAILDGLTQGGQQFELFEHGATNFRERLFVTFNLALDGVLVSGPGVVVTVDRDCRTSAVIIEPERIAAVAAFDASGNSELSELNRKPDASSVRLTNDLSFPAGSVRSDGLRLDASGDRVRAVDRLATSDGRVFVIDRDNQLLLSAGESEGHGAYLDVREAGSLTPRRPPRTPPFESLQTPTKRSNANDNFVTGLGFAYGVDPGSGSAVLQPVNRLRDDGNRLDGKYLRAISRIFDPDGLATQNSGEPQTFVFDPINEDGWECAIDSERCSQFDNVNAYVHIDRFAEDFWQTRLGIEIDWQTTVLTHTPLGGSLVHGDTISLGTGGLFLLNNALEDDIIYHEYVHVVLRHIGFATDIYSTTQRRALGEGYADYFGLSYADHPEFANWATTCPPRFECEGPENSKEIRTLATDPAEWTWAFGSPSVKLKYGLCTRKHLGDTKCKTSYNTFSDTYVWGMIWGSTLWDIRTTLGPDAADPLIAASLALTGGKVFTFTTAAGAILYADKVEFGGAYEQTLRGIFTERGIAPYISVGIENESDVVDDPAALSLTIFPNPFADSITLEIDSVKPARARARFVDVSGREIFSTDLGILPAGRSQSRIDLPQVAEGFYLIQVASDDQIVTRTVVRSGGK